MDIFQFLPSTCNQHGQKYLVVIFFLEPQRGEDVQDQDHVTGGGGQGHEKDQEDDPGRNWHSFSSLHHYVLCRTLKQLKSCTIYTQASR